MTSTGDIPEGLGPEAASPSPAPPAMTPPLRGHHAKITEAVAALRAQDRLPPNLRPSVRDHRILTWLEGAGYGADLPTRHAIRRFFLSERRAAAA